MKHSIKLLLSGTILMVAASCGTDPNDPGIEYAPDMYVSKGYEPYSQLADQKRSVMSESGKEWLINPDGKNMREPVKGTIARGQMDYVFPYAKTPEDYERAGAELRNPFEPTEEVLAEGKHVYEINCTPCHAADGNGQGTIVKDGKYPQVPAYKDRLPTINPGKAYFSITYGKNLMGSYASSLSPAERWKVIHYIYSLAGLTGGAPAAPAADSTASVK